MDSHHRKQKLIPLPTGRHLRSSRKREQRILNYYSMYLAYCGQVYSAKNKLEKAIQAYLESIDRTLIEDEDFKGFKNKVIAEIERICKEDHPRCTPKKPHLWQSGVKRKDKDFTLSGIDCVVFYFYYSDKVN